MMATTLKYTVAKPAPVLVMSVLDLWSQSLVHVTKWQLGAMLLKYVMRCHQCLHQAPSSRGKEIMFINKQLSKDALHLILCEAMTQLQATKLPYCPFWVTTFPLKYNSHSNYIYCCCHQFSKFFAVVKCSIMMDWYGITFTDNLLESCTKNKDGEVFY